MTCQSITFPGLYVRVEGLTPSEHVKKMLDAQAAFLEHEYSSKIKQSESKKVASYMDEHYEKGDKVLYQEQDSKDWIVGVIHDYKSNEVVVTTDVGEKRMHPNRIRRFYEEMDEDEEKDIEEKSDDINNQSTNNNQSTINNNQQQSTINNDGKVTDDKNKRITRSMSKVQFNDVVKNAFHCSNINADFEELRKKDAAKENYDIFMSKIEDDDDDPTSV